MRPVNGQVLMCLVMLAFFGGMVFMAAGYPPAARFLPFVIGIPAVALTLIQLGVELRRAAAATPGGTAARDADRPARRLRHEAEMFLYLVGLMAAILLFGFLIAPPLFVAVFLRLREKESWAVTLGGAAATLAMLYVMFETLLELSLYRGAVAALIAG